ncbi:helix-turn-helix domain-containing protein [Streptomyces sp. GLT-R25]
MKVRADIAALLHAGVAHQDIARQLHVSRNTVRAVHHALKLPPPVRGGGAPHASVADAYRAHAAPVADGHVRWTGTVDGTLPVVFHRGRRTPAPRVAFRLYHGRDPEGRLTRTGVTCPAASQVRTTRTG